MKHILRTILVTALTFAFTMQLATAQEAADRIQIVNTTISIIPPKHFEHDQLSNKIVHPGSLATIQVSEVKGTNYKKITEKITKEYLKTQGLDFSERIDAKTQDGKEASIFISKFMSSDDKGNIIEFERLMFFAGEQNTIWITADYPTCMKKLIGPAITESILSAQQQ